MIAWRRSSSESLQRAFLWPTIAASLLIVALFALGIRHFYALMSFGLCLFVTWTIFGEFFKGSQRDPRQEQDRIWLPRWWN